MATRPAILLVAVGLLLLIGLSGVLVGGGLVAALAGSPRATTTGYLIFGGITLYGLVVTAAGLGLAVGRGWGWPLAIASIVLGLVILVVLLGITGWRDGVIGGGIGIWAASLITLLVARRARP